MIPDDVAALLKPVIAHRLGTQPIESTLRQIVERVQVPVATRA